VSAVPQPESDVREFRVDVQEARIELRPGVTVPAWTYNGQVPGPVIRVREGERVRVAFHNGVDIGTAIHWHGVLVPNAMDGAPGVTQEHVQKGQEFVYEFVARPSGTYIYHAHSHGHNAKQLDMGLVAPIVIEPLRAEYAYDRDLILVLDEWEVPDLQDGNQGGHGLNTMMMDGGIFDTLARYNVGTINAKAAPATEPLTVKAGELVRVRVINTGFAPHRLRIQGHRVWVTHTDGHLLPYPQEVEEIPVAPFERIDAVFVADNPGEWSVEDRNWADRGMKTVIRYDGQADGSPRTWQPPSLPEDAAGFPRYQGLIAGVPGPDSTRYDREVKLMLHMAMSGPNMVWTINNESWPNVTSLIVRNGERVKVRISNMTMEDHPMHLHGHEFQILSINGKTLSEPWLVKDTVNLRHMDTIEVAFTANNPGKWLFHCHQAHHSDHGLSTLVQYE
jgi:FtsP/CotA-like multicopper oxidase with cupredoxin domain